MEKLDYSWKRFWCTREGHIALADDGYLVDPEEKWGPAMNPDVVPFEAISEIPCLALLGEPGIGKSFALTSEMEQVKAGLRDSGDSMLWLDLRSFGSEERLISKLFGSRTFQDTLRDGKRLHIFLDSLDECLLRIDTLATLLIDEFQNFPVNLINLRIACRTGEWPRVLEEGLRRLWGDDWFKAYELSPLRKKDVALAAEINGVSPELFLKEVGEKGGTPFAIKPVTLKFLINTYQKHGTLPSGQKDLYLEGCRKLCEEFNDSRVAARRLGNLTVEQRLIVAARIAVVTIFSNRYAVWTTRDEGDVPAEDVTLRDLTLGSEIANGEEFRVEEDVLNETLSTGLFSSRGPSRLGWSHQTYAEFLAAWYVRQHNPSMSQVNSLLKHPNDPEGRLVPQLHETAAWLASMSAEYFRMIMNADPQVLLRSDISTVEEEDRARLVDSLLRLFEEERLLDRDLGLRRQYKKLKHSRLADQLRPFIADSSKGILVRRVAVDIAEATGLTAVQDDITKVALNSAEPLLVRVNAAYAVNRIGDEQTKEKLKPLAFGQTGDDPDDELKGCGLKATWPSSLTATELFDLLTPAKNQSYYGAYYDFLLSSVADSLNSADLPDALRWVGNNAVDEDWRGFDRLKMSIIEKAVENMDVEGVSQALSQVLLAILKGRDRDFELPEVLANADRRHQILENLLPLLADEENAWIWAIYGRSPYVRNTDIDWLICRLNRGVSQKEEVLLAWLIEKLINYRDPDQFSAVYNAAQINQVLATRLDYMLNPVELNSDQAQRMKAEYEEMKRFETKPDRPLLNPPPDQRIMMHLNALGEGDTSAWWRLNQDMTLEPNSQFYGNELISDLRALPGWKNSNDAVKNRIIEAAKRYLQEGDPKTDEWLERGSPYRSTLAGYRALRLLLEEEPTYIQSIPEDIWRKWTAAILAYPSVGNGRDKEIYSILMSTTFNNAQEEFVRIVLSLVDKETKDSGSGYPYTLDRIEGCWNEEIARALFAKLQEQDLRSESMGRILAELLSQGVPEGKAFAESLISQPVNTEGDSREKALTAACALMSFTKDGAWEALWQAMNRDVELGRDIALKYADTYSERGTPIGSKLTEDQLADLYVWLERQFPQSEDPNPQGVYTVGPRENVAQWRDSLLVTLRERGTSESCQAISRLIDELPELDWLKWTLIDARAITRRKTWIPPEPEDTLKLLARRELRFIESGRQLLHVLVESLARLEAKLQGETPAAIDLWNDLGGNVYRPKDENHFSDYVKRFLDDDLKDKGIVVNREVEIRRSMGGAPGERTDILVDAILRDRAGRVIDIITAIIEAKGCWHAELNTAMETQLVNRYLKDNSCQHGLYFVGWFNCPQWDTSDPRQQRSPQIDKAEVEAQFDAQADELSTRLSVDIVTVVLNTALR